MFGSPAIQVVGLACVSSAAGLADEYVDEILPTDAHGKVPKNKAGTHSNVFPL